MRQRAGFRVLDVQTAVVSLTLTIALHAPAAAQTLLARVDDAAVTDARPDAAEAAPTTLPSMHDWFGSRGWADWTTVTGDWNSVRSRLGTRGLAIAATQITDVSTIRSADATRATLGRGLFGTSVAADLAELVHLHGGSAYAQLQWRPGANASAALGDLQVFSNIDADHVPLLGEAWYEQRLGSHVRAKGGRIDANTEFASLEASGDFLSSSMAFSPSIDGLPTYPDPSTGVLVAAEGLSHVRVAAAVFDGTAGRGVSMHWAGRFSIVQAGGDWTLRGLAGSASIGHFDRWRDAGDDAATGSYVSAEQAFWQQGARQAAAFVQAGWSDAGSAIRRHVGSGVALTGLLTRRPHDVTGLGATWARLDSPDPGAGAELVVEAFHRIALTPSISLIPDAQVLRHPAGDAARPSTVVWTMRVRLDL